MVSDVSHPGLASDADFGFAYNNCNFSDRLLRIEITDGPSNSSAGGDDCTNIIDWAQHRKRRREDIKKDTDVTIPDIVTSCPKEQIVTDNQPDKDGGENIAEEEPEARVEERRSGDEDTSTSDTNRSVDCSTTVIRVREVHISSPILAAKSPFFYKLFSNGMKESEERHVTLRIRASEEGALMELLNFMYSNVLTVTTAPAILDVLMAADKFEVASCMHYCCKLLCDLPMTLDSALLYLELSSSNVMAEAMKHLTDVAKQFLASRYKDITEYQEEVMTLSLAGMETILASDDLQFGSEDAVYDFVCEWARLQYPCLEERQEILGERLARYIRFPFMSCRKLKKISKSNDFKDGVITEYVLEALFFKAAPHVQRNEVIEQAASLNRRFIERPYKFKLLRGIQLNNPWPYTLVYLDFKREECMDLFPSGAVLSQAFSWNGQGFFLYAKCSMNRQTSDYHFGLFLSMRDNGPASVPVEYEFWARSKPTQDYITKSKGKYTFTQGAAVGFRNLFGIPWPLFVAEDCPYFINGILHLKAELSIKPSLYVDPIFLID